MLMFGTNQHDSVKQLPSIKNKKNYKKFYNQKSERDNRNRCQNYPDVRISRQKFKMSIINMFKGLEKSMVILSEHMGTLNREMKTI